MRGIAFPVWKATNYRTAWSPRDTKLHSDTAWRSTGTFPGVSKLRGMWIVSARSLHLRRSSVDVSQEATNPP
jgi:hypothetical protein